MTGNNPRQDNMNQRDLESWRKSWRSLENEPFDRELDSALASYAAIEPRAGLEQRILANLHAEQKHALVRPRWRWPAIGALSLVVVFAALLVAWRFTRPSQNFAVHHLPTTTLPVPETQIASNIKAGDHGPATPAMQKKKPRTLHPENENASAPKLDVFPSPEPLSEQEKMLAAYVAQHHQQAVLIARARMEELKEDLAKETTEENSPSNRRPSDQSMSQQEQASAENR
jgi:hypothetical protein